MSSIYPRHRGTCPAGPDKFREFIPCAVAGRGIAVFALIFEKLAVKRRLLGSVILGIGGVSDTLGIEVRDIGVGMRDFEVGGDIRDIGRRGVVVGVCCVGVALPVRGIRLGVMTTAGILVGGEPRTLAFGDAFHRGRA